MTRRELIEGLVGSSAAGASLSDVKASEIPKGAKAILVCSFDRAKADMYAIENLGYSIVEELREVGLDKDVAVIFKEDGIEMEIHKVDPKA